jgi:hypothetical protein
VCLSHLSFMQTPASSSEDAVMLLAKIVPQRPLASRVTVITLTMRTFDFVTQFVPI